MGDYEKNWLNEYESAVRNLAHLVTTGDSKTPAVPEATLFTDLKTFLHYVGETPSLQEDIDHLGQYLRAAANSIHPDRYSAVGENINRVLHWFHVSGSMVKLKKPLPPDTLASLQRKNDRLHMEIVKAFEESEKISTGKPASSVASLRLPVSRRTKPLEQKGLSGEFVYSDASRMWERVDATTQFPVAKTIASPVSGGSTWPGPTSSWPGPTWTTLRDLNPLSPSAVPKSPEEFAAWQRQAVVDINEMIQEVAALKDQIVLLKQSK